MTKTIDQLSKEELQAELERRADEEAAAIEAQSEALVESLEKKFDDAYAVFATEKNELDKRFESLKNDLVRLCEDHGFPGSFGLKIYRPKSFKTKWKNPDIEKQLSEDCWDEYSDYISDSVNMGSSEYPDAGWWQPSAFC